MYHTWERREVYAELWSKDLKSESGGARMRVYGLD
jgi:hypothetical protein